MDPKGKVITGEVGDLILLNYGGNYNGLFIINHIEDILHQNQRWYLTCLHSPTNKSQHCRAITLLRNSHVGTNFMFHFKDIDLKTFSFSAR